MANTYKGILTNNGKALIANATVNNKINYSHIAVGDGNGSVPTPSETRPTLINEKARIALNVVEINPNNTNQIVCEAIIPTNTGGFYIRELGLYAGNTMIVNASYPPTYKPLADEGGAREIAIKIVINIQNAEVIALYLDDSLIYATREWVNTNYIRRNEIVDNLITDASNKPLSAKQGKYLEENKLNRAIKIPENADLNDYQAQGSYLVDYNLTAETIKNSPTKLAFALNVEITAGCVQRLTTYKDAGTLQYIRSQYTGGWTPWYKVYSELDPQPSVAEAKQLETELTAYTNDQDFVKHFSGKSKAFFDNGAGKFFTQYSTGLVSSFSEGGTFMIACDVLTGKTKIINCVVRQNGSVDNLIKKELAYTDSNITGNAATASKLQISRNITIAGDANGTTYFDGTSNVTINMVLAVANTSAGTYGANSLQIPVFTVDQKGRITSAGNRILPSASTTTQGAVQLNNTLTSTSTTEALTAAQGKTLFDTKLSKSTKISSGDLNNYQEPGMYWCDADAEAATILNLPTPFAFSLFVERHAGTKQTFTEYSTNRTFIRRFYNGWWTSWKEIAFTEDQTFKGTSRFNGDVQVDGAIYAQKFRGESDFWFTSNDGGIAKKVLSGGLLASSNYADVSYVPENGIYSKGNILTSGGFFTTRAETTISNSTGRYLFINQQKWGAFDPATGYVPLSVDCGGTGNGQGIAPSATKLQIARKINDVSFDGTGDINITAPMRYLGNVNTSSINDAISDGFYLVADVNISGLYPYGILEVRVAGNTIHQTYYSHNDSLNGSVAVRQSWGGKAAFTPWRVLDSHVAEVSPIPFAGDAIPTGYIAMMGQAISQSSYPILYSVYGAYLLDMRGEFVRGWDAGRGVDSGRGLRTWQGDAMRNITGTVGGGANDYSSGVFYESYKSNDGQEGSRFRQTVYGLDVSRQVPVANEIRPRNIAFNYIVRAI
ncbi:phage tail-collar fiber domain-containing protein [Acinetobacter bereziniae]|uniref:phage tail-collar fiber domain-containing protein n=1 Tax=Acinetobacter bereziniae TaxID=106648 RepID=UPI001901A120|nr:phage tail protein [Acinetobacter bereziniae]MBJ8475345.1 phage tail protein [Acinetobacter bereziniae]